MVSYYLKDHLGSTRTLLSSGGTAEATYDYWPYGEVLASSGTDSAPFKFTGHERDAESGLDFMLFRSYRPGSLRFLQVDPAAEKYPGLSPYAYAANNPLTFTDARGDTLDVGGMNDGRTALSYLHSMVDEETAKRVTMGDGGRISFDTEGLDLSQDSALELLNNLVNSSGKFLFEVGDNTSAVVRESFGDLQAGTNVDIIILHKSSLGIQSYSRTPRDIDGGIGSSGFLPKSGYDGQVAMSPGYWTFDPAGEHMMPISNVTFHELAEIYHRTIGKQPYTRADGSGAHRQAIEDAKRFRKQVQPPTGTDAGKAKFWLTP